MPLHEEGNTHAKKGGKKEKLMTVEKGNVAHGADKNV